VKQRPRRVILRKLLLRRRGNKRLWPALLSLCLGTAILLYAIILYTGFRDALSGKYDKSSIEGTYLTISKQIDAEQEITKQKPALFSNTEIRALGSLPVVQDIGMFTSARFPVEVAFKGDSMQFSTRLFIESVPDRFIDNKPLDWYWQYTAKEVPVIVSTEFLNLYNYGYASNQGVPQLTMGTIQSLHFTLNIGTGNNAAEYTARVAGFSDRISSILVPEAFIQYGNKHFAPAQQEPQPSRLILKVKDPSDDLLVEYLHEARYETNNELLRANPYAYGGICRHTRYGPAGNRFAVNGRHGLYPLHRVDRRPVRSTTCNCWYSLATAPASSAGSSSGVMYSSYWR